jgi:hypothetical protein
MQKIHFTVFSQAYYVDSNWGFGCPSGGIKRMGDIFHNYNIPITWLVSPKSARCEQEMLTSFHKDYGDEIAMMFRFDVDSLVKHHSNERETANNMSIEDYRKAIKKQKAEIENYLPWANIRIVGQGIRTENMLRALKMEGFLGVFGHCYCQIGTDSITDFGAPWGSFPMDPKEYHRPVKENEDGLIAFEWTQRDLTKSFHTAFPELWSTDPNDVERGGVCTDDNVEWWKRMYEQYERALKLNEQGIWFQFHQEAHEMTWGEVCKPFSEDRVIFTSDMMDEFLDWLVERDTVHFLTASDAAELYLQSKQNGTIPMYFPSAWTPVEEGLPFWDQVKNRKGYAGNISKHAKIPNEALYNYLSKVNNKDPLVAMKNPPWLDSFFYYDSECQLVFDINQTQPVAIFNYLNYEPIPEILEDMGDEKGGGTPGFFLEEKIPIPNISGDFNTKITIDVRSHQEKVIPYGLFLWKENFDGVIQYFEKLKDKIAYRYKISPDQWCFSKI